MINGKNYAVFSTTKPAPDTISKNTFSWDWQVTSVNGNNLASAATFGTMGGHTVYVLYAAPAAPWSSAAGNTLNPWMNVLDYVCTWAQGKSTPAETVERITSRAYTGLGKTYNGGDSHTSANSCNFSGLLADSWADCRDMSAVVQLFANAVGVPSNDIKVRRIQGGFQTCPIQPMNWPWQSVWWNFHQVGWYNNSVYDACIRACQNAPYIPAGVALNNYEMDVRLPLSGNWLPQTPHIITTIQ